MGRADYSERVSSGSSSNALGTFSGVFTPSILTILGVIMFMRAGFVVGQAGIFYALLILVLAKGITTMTAFSSNCALLSEYCPGCCFRSFFRRIRGGPLGHQDPVFDHDGSRIVHHRLSIRSLAVLSDHGLPVRNRQHCIDVW